MSFGAPSRIPRFSSDLLSTPRQQDRSRRRHAWQLLAWSLIMSGAFDSAGRASAGDLIGADTSGEVGAPDKGPAPLHEEAADASQVVEAYGPAAEEPGPAMPEHLAGEEAARAPDGSAAAARTSGINPGHLSPPATQYPAGAPHPGAAKFTATFEQLIEIDPEVPFFEGLEQFAQQLGFANGLAELIEAVDPSLRPALASALQVTENPLARVALWQGLSDAPPPVQFWQGDKFEADWVVQANGLSDDGRPLVSSVDGVAASQTNQLLDSGVKTMGNTATIVDGGDWEGTLWVAKNYFEFNTIVQVNLLWDNDSVIAVSAGAAGVGAGTGTIATGQNLQANNAQIIDLNGTLDLDGSGNGGLVEGALNNTKQLILGGSYEHFSAVQLNSITDIDQILLAVADHYALVESLSDTIDFAPIASSGHIQTNTALMVGGLSSDGNGMSVAQFYAEARQGEVTFVNGNYYEFNTVFQINVAFDTDSYLGRIDADGIIASGGNVQFNEARILENDNQDSLFVGGRYTEYNLVLQINALEDSDLITQISAMAHGIGAASAAIDAVQPDGVSQTGTSESVTLPSVMYDQSVRGSGIDAGI